MTEDDEHDLQVRACRLHTDFYAHSLAEYVRHFAGRDATYVSVDAPDASAQAGSFDRLLRALGLDVDAAAGDPVLLRPTGCRRSPPSSTTAPPSSSACAPRTA